MKRLWIIGLLFNALFSLTQNVSSQTVKVERVFERIETVRNPIPLNFQTNQLIEQYISYYQGRGKPAMEVGLYRYGMHEKMIRQIFNEEAIPEDLSWIHQVERMWDGGLRPPGFPRPLWLFTPDVAKKYGLEKTKYLDETKSFEKATRAKAQYLKFLYEKYDKNWELALGAYAIGAGNVNSAIKRAKVRDYWMIYKYLPRETKNFVPNVLAVILIGKNQTTYGFEHICFAPQLNYEILRVQPSLSLWTITQLADTSIDYIRYLNPELRVNVTPAKPYLVRVPMGRGNIIAEKLRGRK